MSKETVRIGSWTSKISRFLVTAIIPAIILCLLILEVGLRARGRLPSNAKDGIFIQFDGILRSFDALLASKKTKPVYVYLPASPDLKLYEFLAQKAENHADYDFSLIINFLSKHCSLAKLEMANSYPILKQHQLKIMYIIKRTGHPESCP